MKTTNTTNVNPINRIENKWIRPWNTKQFNDLYNRDDRFFSVILKGLINYLNNHVKMYDKPINHFIFNTGSSYLYVESNGYEFSWNETTGEDTMYMDLPRCVIQMSNISIPTEELSQPFARGNYERKDEDKIKGYNSEIQRLPLEINIDLHYVFSNFNEGIVVIQELLDEFVFQQYFNITYLGQIIKCSIEFPTQYNIEFNNIDLASTEFNQRSLNIPIIINTNYPIINTKTEILTSKVISTFMGFIETGKRSDNVEILIDGLKSNLDDVYFDLRIFDFNTDGKIDDSELDILNEFIERFDVDGDEEVTSKDINIISEKFYNNEYDLNYDLINAGQVNLDNLLMIKKLFMTLDINHDESVSNYEVQYIIKIIKKFLPLDINHDLLIDYKDINNIVNYLDQNTNIRFQDLFNDCKKYIENTIKPISEEFYSFVYDILLHDIQNYKIAIEYWILNNEISGELKDFIDSKLDELYNLFKSLNDFLKYDFNNDGILDENDANYVENIINENTEYKISFYKSSQIIIHQNDPTLQKDSITDIENYRNISSKSAEEETTI